MLEFKIQSINDIYALKNVSDRYEKIYIDTSKLKYQGVLRHAFKYALWALKKNGTIELVDEPHNGYGFRKSKIEFWQVRNEFFRVLKNEIEVLINDQDKGRITVQKIKDNIIPKGISFCFVYSGQEIELEQLLNSFTIISKFRNVEILLCGPTENRNNPLFSEFGVKYFDFDLKDKNRVLYTKKKNILFEKSIYDIVIIAHTRILMTDTFIKEINSKQFDILTPRILFKGNKKNHRYLDYLLIPSYNLTQTSLIPTIGLNKINKNYLYLQKNRVPFIDGGLVVFNKLRVFERPFSDYLGWGEAEDVEMSEYLYQRGYLIDFDYDLICFSQTNKLDFESTKLQRIFRRLKKAILK